jgi:hypothetical protein
VASQAADALSIAFHKFVPPGPEEFVLYGEYLGPVEFEAPVCGHVMGQLERRCEPGIAWKVRVLAVVSAPQPVPQQVELHFMSGNLPFADRRSMRPAAGARFKIVATVLPPVAGLPGLSQPRLRLGGNYIQGAYLVPMSPGESVECDIVRVRELGQRGATTEDDLFELRKEAARVLAGNPEEKLAALRRMASVMWVHPHNHPSLDGFPEYACPHVASATQLRELAHRHAQTWIGRGEMSQADGERYIAAHVANCRARRQLVD